MDFGSIMDSWQSNDSQKYLKFKYLPSGKHTKSYWKWPFMVDFPIKNDDVPSFFVNVYQAG